MLCWRIKNDRLKRFTLSKMNLPCEGCEIIYNLLVYNISKHGVDYLSNIFTTLGTYFTTIYLVKKDEKLKKNPSQKYKYFSNSYQQSTDISIFFQSK